VHDLLCCNSVKCDKLFMSLGNILPALTTGCICATGIDSREAKSVHLHSCKSKRS
jgi:hypothetical protein